jgi:hypothetical protein
MRKRWICCFKSGFEWDISWATLQNSDSRLLWHPVRLINVICQSEALRGHAEIHLQQRCSYTRLFFAVMSGMIDEEKKNKNTQISSSLKMCTSRDFFKSKGVSIRRRFMTHVIRSSKIDNVESVWALLKEGGNRCISRPPSAVSSYVIGTFEKQSP